MRPGELGGCALGLDGSGTAFMTLIDDYDIRMQQGSFWGFIYSDIYHFNLESYNILGNSFTGFTVPYLIVSVSTRTV
jgi:hypothetical protein